MVGWVGVTNQHATHVDGTMDTKKSMRRGCVVVCVCACACVCLCVVCASVCVCVFCCCCCCFCEGSKQCGENGKTKPRPEYVSHIRHTTIEARRAAAHAAAVDVRID